MKTHIIVLCFVSVGAFAQDVVAPVDPVPPAPPAIPVPAIAPIPPVAPAFALPGLAAVAEVIHATGAAALAQAKEAVEKAKSDVARAHADIAFGLGDSGKYIFGRSAKPGRTLVIPGKDLGGDASDALEEDLNVMARILEKAVERKSDDDGPKAMGIDVFSAGSSSGVRNLYLDGYGALFILKVRFPLVPPPDKTELSKTNEPSSSTWAEARRELYGPRTEWGEFSKGFRKTFTSPTEDYDADKVEKLKDSLLEALKNASNVRHLKSDEKVAVAVTGSVGSADMLRKRVTSENRGSGRAGVYAVDVREAKSEGGQSVLTIQARKSDIDSFAKGKLTLEEFRKKATMTLH